MNSPENNSKTFEKALVEDSQRLPYAHLAIIDATNLSPYALEPLGVDKQTSWQCCLAKYKLLPHSLGLPCVCLLPPKERQLHPKLAVALETLKQQGLYPVQLENDSEAALLKAVKHSIELFYPDAFRPDPVIKSLQAYQRSRQELEKKETGEKSLNEKPSPFQEEIALPLAMRYAKPEQLERAENLSSRQVHCYWLDGDAPLLSLELIKQLYRQHHQAAAELSFSDIYPVGLVPVLFQAAILGRLWHLQQPESKADGILKIAQRDLNLFAAEPLLAQRDYRYLRLDLRARSKRQWLALRNLYSSLSNPAVASLGINLPQASPEFLAEILKWVETSNLRTLPRYFPIQISALCPQHCSYCAYPKMKHVGANFMSRDLWRQWLAELVEFASDAVVNLSPLGEPMLHPEFLGFVEDLLAYPSLELLIETSGVHWAAAELQTLLEWNQRERRITWILSLDALDAELYRRLRPASQGSTEAQQERAFSLAELLLFSEQSLPQQVYLQAVRMEDNEQDLENFYRYWVEGQVKKNVPTRWAEGARPKLNPAQVIIQKYNSYAGFLPERQPVRLDPLERFPCRRLAREMVFGIDGQAFLCVQDLEQKLAKGLSMPSGLSMPKGLSMPSGLGRFPESSLAELWKAGQALYQKHVEGVYPSLCENCDEYYVYNF